MMRGGRIASKKSRYGCLRCKARHVKCDEQTPCLNCVRHSVQCSLTLTGPPAKLPTIAPNQESISSAGLDSHVAAEPCSLSRKHVLVSKASAIKQLASELESEIKALNQELQKSHDTSQGQGISDTPGGGHISSADWMRSLQLFYHYCTSTCLTLAVDPPTVQLWQITVPEIAISHEILMHGLLAVSSLHNAHVNSEQRKAYTLVSIQYQTLALESFSKRLTDINKDNCQAYFLLASFIFMLTTYSIANPQDREEAITSNDVAQSFILLQGIKSILEFPTTQNWRREGPLSVLFWAPGEAITNELSGPFIARLEKLSALIRELPAAFEAASPQSSCLLALEALKSTYISCDESTDGPRRVWLWPFTVPQEFLYLLGDGHPMALIILSHFAALARPFEDGHWMQRGWSGSVMAVVERSMDRRWKEWIEWPMRCIREGSRVDEMAD